MSKTSLKNFNTDADAPEALVLNFEFRSFEIVSNFDIRISDLNVLNKLLNINDTVTRKRSLYNCYFSLVRLDNGDNFFSALFSVFLPNQFFKNGLQRGQLHQST